MKLSDDFALRMQTRVLNLWLPLLFLQRLCRLAVLAAATTCLLLRLEIGLARGRVVPMASLETGAVWSDAMAARSVIRK